MAYLNYSTDLVIGLAVQDYGDGDIYVWAFKSGDEFEYFDYSLEQFGGDRIAICQHSLFQILSRVIEDEGSCPQAICIYRDSKEKDVSNYHLMASEYNGIQNGIRWFSESKAIPLPIHRYLAVIEGTNTGWVHFTLNGGQGPYDTDTTYWVVGPSLESINMAYLVQFTNVFSFSTGFVKACWKARNFYDLNWLRNWAIKVLRGQATGLLVSEAHQLIKDTLTLLYNP